jgi:hypothetical protein
MTSGMHKVIAKFLNADGEPVTGSGFAVGLRDKDMFFDDRLGVSRLNGDGEAEFMFSPTDILSIDSIGETRPDLYFVVWKDGDEIFRSEVFENVDFEAADPVTGRRDDLTRSFGPFRLDV